MRHTRIPLLAASAGHDSTAARATPRGQGSIPVDAGPRLLLAPVCLLLSLTSIGCGSNDDTPPPDENRNVTCGTGEVLCFDTDADGDGFAPNGSGGRCEPLMTAGCVANEGDCDDTNRQIRPDAIEVPGDTIDNDCDGEVDEPPVAPTERTDIYWGDTHVHTRFSFDAYVTMSRSELNVMDGDPIKGELVFARDVREACDFGRFCSKIDFMASTEHSENVPESLWGVIKDQLRQCDAAYGPTTAAPSGLSPLHVFAGWEWTQGNPDATGSLPPLNLSSQTQYGHKNVIYPDLEDSNLPVRVVGSSILAPTLDQFCSVARLCGIPEGTVPTFTCPLGRTVTASAATQALNNLLTNTCDGGMPIDTDDPRFARGGECFGVCAFLGDGGNCNTCDYSAGCDLDDSAAQVMTSTTCPQLAFTAGGLFELVQSWQDRFGYPLPVVGAHGTSWFNGGHGNWGANYPELGPTMRDPGNFRQHDPQLQTFIEVMSKHGSLELYPSDPQENENCYDVAEGTANECFQPSSSDGIVADATTESGIQYVKEGTAQYALSQQLPGVDGDFALNLGMLASMDTHHARPGSAVEYPPFSEWESMEVFCSFGGVSPEDCPLQFTYAGGLAAVHAQAGPPAGVRSRIFRNLRERQVFGTSGPRIELWFYMTNPPSGTPCIEGTSGECPMGSLVPSLSSAFIPRFRVHSKGAKQTSTDCQGQPAPTGWDGGARAFHADVCRDQCFHVTSDADADRTRIRHLEVVRVLRGWLGTDGQADFTQFTVDTVQDDATFGAGPAIHTVDTIRLRCAGAGPLGAQDCWAEFEDPQWRTIVERGGNAVYYVRAIQEETSAYNGPTGTADEMACADPTAEEGEALSCFGPTHERAWSSPIFLFSGRAATRLPPVP